MREIRIPYTIEYGDYLVACCYGVILRHTTGFRIAFYAVVLSGVYTFGAALRFFPLTYLIPFLGVAYLVWLLAVFSQVLLSARKYARLPDNLLGVESELSLNLTALTLDIPSRKVHFTVPLKELPCVIEQGKLFMIYFTANQTCLLPHRCLKDGQRTQLHRFFAKHLGERFSTNFDEYGTPLKKPFGVFSRK